MTTRMAEKSLVSQQLTPHGLDGHHGLFVNGTCPDKQRQVPAVSFLTSENEYEYSLEYSYGSKHPLRK